MLSWFCSGVGSPVGILSKFFTGNNMLLKLLRTFSLSLKIILSYSRKQFLNCFLPLSKFFISETKLPWSSSASFNDKYLSCISLKKQ